MRYLSLVRGGLGFAALVAGLTACSGVKFQTSPPPTGAVGPFQQPGVPDVPDSRVPIVISAQQLAQEFYDDPKAAEARYLHKYLQVEGVVTHLDSPGGGEFANGKSSIDMIVCGVQVRNKTKPTGVHFPLQLMLNEPMKPGDPKYGGLAIGKSVTVRGDFAGGVTDPNFPQATLVSCFVK